MPRTASIARKTKETDIAMKLVIDGTGASTIKSGNGFLDHMLTLCVKHGLFDFELKCKGDLEVDFHHSAEDIGICLGKAIDKALGDKKGITRFGTAYVPMDESLARVCLDISGRSTLFYGVNLVDRVVNDFEVDLAHDFFKALADNAKMTLHIDLLRGRNTHHSLEAVFKAFGRALYKSCSINTRGKGSVPSTKGVI